MKTVLAILLTLNLGALIYNGANGYKRDKRISELEKDISSKIELVNNFSINQDSSYTSFHLMIPKSINDSNIIWLKIKVKSIKDMKELTILN